MSFQYDQYLDQHKANVKRGFDWIQENLPELLKGGFDYGWQICFAHDQSKSEPDEYKAYDAYFYGGNRSYSVVRAYEKAWLIHLHRNPHHWQHWILINDDPKEGELILEMPYNYIVEMICDWWAFSWQKGKLDEIFSWYDEHSEYMKLHPTTRKTIENILNRLIEGKTLTPIEDTDDIWDKCTYRKEFDLYQCKRMSSLFKDIYPDGNVKYHDNNRVCCINVDNPNVSYHSGLVSNLINEMYPITMPYFPESKPFMVHCEEFLTDPKNGDFNTVGILYVIKPNGDRVEINRFFKEGEDDFVEIASCEYEMRRKMHEERLENLNKESEKDCHGCFGASDNSCGHCAEERPV